jgi:hypothetical protein
MRILIPTVIVLAIAAGIVAAKMNGLGPFNTTLPVTLPPPTTLEQRLTSGSRTLITPGGWINHASIDLSGLRTGLQPDMRLQVEVDTANSQFSGKPTATGTPSSSDPSVIVHRLKSGAYRWWARFYNGSAVSPWVAFSAGPAFRVDLRPPSAPVVSSPTDPVPSRVYHSPHLVFSWSSQDGGSGVAGYWYRFDSDRSSSVTPYIRTTTPSLTLNGITTGTYYLHVRARDVAGNWSAETNFPVHLDTTPPRIVHVFFSRYQFNPQFQDLTVSFTVTRLARVRLGIYNQSNQALVRLVALGTVTPGQRVHFIWHGRDDHGQLVPAGKYEIYIRPTDPYGNTSLSGYADLLVFYKRILISLSQQRLWAYDGNHLFLTSLVTTGNPALPTPTGNYEVLGKFHPYKFISPWPKSSPYYYPPSVVQYALYFLSGGYFIHDAPWRSVFGPGSNAELGTPGENYTGTHGCVNTPPNVAYELYQWAPLGTPVQIVK